MAETQSLREYQRLLSARLLNPQSAPAAVWLGVESGGLSWLLDMVDIEETLPVPAFNPVPLCRSWLAGVASIRGNLHTLIDLGAFAGFTAAVMSEQSRVVLIAERHRRYCGLLVDRVSGLFRADQFAPAAGTPAGQPWITNMNMTQQNDHRVWFRPAIRELIQAPAFLNIAA